MSIGLVLVLERFCTILRSEGDAGNGILRILKRKNEILEETGAL